MFITCTCGTSQEVPCAGTYKCPNCDENLEIPPIIKMSWNNKEIPEFHRFVNRVGKTTTLKAAIQIALTY